MKYDETEILYEVGDWVVDKPSGLVFRITSFIDGCYWHEEYFNLETKYWNKMRCYTNKVEHLRPATQLEIDEANSYKKKELLIKVGDWVTIDNLKDPRSSNVEPTGMIGATFMVGELVKDGVYTWASGNWNITDRISGTRWFLENLRRATQGEVIRTLEKEAIKRYPKGSRFYSAYPGTLEHSLKVGNIGQITMDSNGYRVWNILENGTNVGFLYYHDKWAKIINDIYIGDNKVEFIKSSDESVLVKVGCETYQDQKIYSLAAAMQAVNAKAVSVEGHIVLYTTMSEIVERLNHL